MTTRIPYSAEFDPPCPVLAVRVAAPAGGAGLGLVAVVDTGADMTIVPEPAARALGLPTTSEIRISGVTGAAETADVCAAAIELAGRSVLTEVVAFGAETIVGRDLLNQLVLRLDGPGRVMSLATPTVRRRMTRAR